MSAPQYTILIPKNTPASNPIEVGIALMAGKILFIDVGFHVGANNLVHIAIYDQLKQILPGIEGQSLAWNGYVFHFPYNMIVPGVGKTLTVKGWSDGTLYSHKVELWFHMLSQDELEQPLTLADIFKYTPNNGFVD